MPAPAVIPAPGVSMMIAAVKGFVVGAERGVRQALTQGGWRTVIPRNKERLGARQLSDEG